VTRLEGYGAVSRALVGGGAAIDLGPNALVYNPAALRLSSGETEVSVGVGAILAMIHIRRPDTGEVAAYRTRATNQNPYILPEFALSWNAGPARMAFGVIPEGGAGTEYGHSSHLSRTTTGDLDTGLRVSSRLFELRVPLAAAIEPRQGLRLGVVVEAISISLNLAQLFDAQQLGALASLDRVDGGLADMLGSMPELAGAHVNAIKERHIDNALRAWGWGGRLGLLWDATPATRIGLAYNMRSRVGDLSGNATLTAIQTDDSRLTVDGRMKVIDFNLPAWWALGIAHQLDDRLRLITDVQYLKWSEVFDDIRLGFTSLSGDLNVRLPQEYDDQIVGIIGLEYQSSPLWTWRGGFSYGTQAVPGENLSPVMPGIVRSHLGVGFTRHLEGGRAVDLAISYALQARLSNGGNNANSTSPIEGRHQDVSLLLNYRYRP
jgi:long-chain fatty acid transport protein